MAPTISSDKKRKLHTAGVEDFRRRSRTYRTATSPGPASINCVAKNSWSAHTGPPGLFTRREFVDLHAGNARSGFAEHRSGEMDIKPPTIASSALLEEPALTFDNELSSSMHSAGVLNVHSPATSSECSVSSLSDYCPYSTADEHMLSDGEEASLASVRQFRVDCEDANQESIVTTRLANMTVPPKCDDAEGSTSCSNSKPLLDVCDMKHSGLLTVAMKTFQLVKRNQLLQRRLRQLQLETSEFIDSVLANPENSRFREKYKKRSQQI